MTLDASPRISDTDLCWAILSHPGLLSGWLDRKIRCTGGLPCDSCERLGKHCVYVKVPREVNDQLRKKKRARQLQKDAERAAARNASHSNHRIQAMHPYWHSDDFAPGTFNCSRSASAVRGEMYGSCDASSGRISLGATAPRLPEVHPHAASSADGVGMMAAHAHQAYGSGAVSANAGLDVGSGSNGSNKGLVTAAATARSVSSAQTYAQRSSIDATSYSSWPAEARSCYDERFSEPGWYNSDMEAAGIMRTEARLSSADSNKYADEQAVRTTVHGALAATQENMWTGAGAAFFSAHDEGSVRTAWSSAYALNEPSYAEFANLDGELRFGFGSSAYAVAQCSESPQSSYSLRRTPRSNYTCSPVPTLDRTAGSVGMRASPAMLSDTEMSSSSQHQYDYLADPSMPAGQMKLAHMDMDDVTHGFRRWRTARCTSDAYTAAGHLEWSG